MHLILSLVSIIPTTRGRFVTGLTSPDSATMEWMSMFDMVEIGGIGDLPDVSTLQELRASGVRHILLYDWMPAGYHYLDGEDEPFMQWVYGNRDTLTLNPSGPFPHCAEYGWCEEYYFDLAIDTLVAARVSYLSGVLDSLGYDGMLFDWGGGAFISSDDYAFVRDTYYSRHPDYPYPEAVASFYRELKTFTGKLIVTNQGFRNARYILPEVDLDMTESYAVGEDYFGDSLYVEGYGYIAVPRTVYYPVSTTYPDGSIEDQIYYLRLLKDYFNTYGPQGFSGFIYMNYAAPTFLPTGDTVDGHPVYALQKPLNAIYFGYAIAMLENFIVYTEVPFDHAYERDSIYFYDLGEPLDTGFTSPEPGVYVRYYTNGLVMVGEWQETTVVSLSSPHIPDSTPAYDAYSKSWTITGDNTIRIEVEPEWDPLTGRMAPSGRVILYDIPTSSEEARGTPGDSQNQVLLSNQAIWFGVEGTLFDIAGRKVMDVKRNSSVPYTDLKGGIYILKIGTGKSIKIPIP